MKRVFVLGAPDPEMVEIEAVLREHGENFVYALATDGKRVHPGNAYKMALPGRLDVDEVVFVECGFADGHPCDWLADVKLAVVDHHRPGDHGYGRGPADYMSASSLGQVLNLLGIPHNPTCSVCGSEDIRFAGVDSGGWCPYCNGSEDFTVLGPTPQQRIIAAADHCLAAAYRGQCPGVDPDALMKWRVETRAAFQKRSTKDILADVERAREILRSKLSWSCYKCGATGSGRPPGMGYGCCGYDDFVATEWVDLRGQQHVPELPEAAVREGIPFVSSVKDRDGREKIVLQAASAWLVKLFLRGLMIPGLTDLYGDPARGFAGGYEKK
ncbi:MAG: hypothetical protein Q8P07_00260 [bacterium]|nr:hypothetical protein [bacterium]